MDTNIDVWPAELNHFTQLIEIGKTYYATGHPALTEEFLAWFYLHNPAGKATLVIAHEEGIWIGVIALIPVLLQRAGQMQKACFAVNVLTHPEHRSKNLFVKMIRRAKEYLAADDTWLLGHPNANAMPGWRRQKMQFREPLKLRMAKWRSPFSGVKITRIKNGDQLRELPVDFWASMAERNDVHLLYSPEFIEWRFLDAPHREYTVAAIYHGGSLMGLRVTRTYKGPVALLVDYVAPLASLTMVVGSATSPTLVMHSGCGLGKEHVQAGSWKLPLNRTFPFFVTRWTAAVQPLDVSGITLAASDF